MISLEMKLGFVVWKLTDVMLVEESSMTVQKNTVLFSAVFLHPQQKGNFMAKGS